MDASYDVIIAGAGFSGVVMASRLHSLRPEWKLAMVDKESRPGGRLISTSLKDNTWSFGLNGLNSALCECLDQALKNNPDADDLADYITGQRRRLGVLAAGKVSEVELADSFGEKGARAIAGIAASRDWKLVDELLSRVEAGKKADQALGQSWGGTRKSPSAIVLEHLANLWGVPDIWTLSNKVLVERAREFADSTTMGKWDRALAAILDSPGLREQLDCFFDSRILDASYDDEQWRLRSSKGELRAKRLVVAHNPWDALLWLPKSLWPSRLMAVPSKTKPASSVLLCEEIKVTGTEVLPDMILIPAENIQVVVEADRYLSFQATLNYELTLQAPAVVKAVKRLRRARKKLLAAYPGLELEGDHLALVPVAWSQALTVSERRVLEKLDLERSQAKHLVFCGDAYGPSVAGDQNLLTSMRSAYERLCQE